MAYRKLLSLTIQSTSWSLLLFSLTAWMPVSAAESITVARQSTTTFQGSTNKNHYPAGISTSAAKSTARANSITSNRRTIQHHDHGLWIYDVFINLSNDFDYDGHYSSFNVSIDVETDFSPRTVYAVLYLSRSHGPLLEYAVTGNFTVRGTGSDDAIFVETSLDYGYPRGYYDHHVEIYDAFNHSLLVSYGPNQSHHVQGIPFESYEHDHRVSPVSVQLSFSGSGSMTAPTVVFFMMLLLIRRYFYKTDRP